MTKFLGSIAISTILAIYKTFAIYYLWSSLGVPIVGLPKLEPIQIYILVFIYKSFSVHFSSSEIKALEEDDDSAFKSRLIIFTMSSMIFAVTFVLKLILL
jgi:hypothetical protein